MIAGSTARNLLLAGAAGDVATTHIGIAVGASEANPAATTAVDGAGLGGLVIA